ncbi:hypothetical protein LQ318_05320 [Aliifodinibius salicampi]|uniref:Uncharacterized protein n=1 Tax=Fodinibius salicampi TaxID=1920655 RepID=A0ABT3PWV7_9BACT|nr:hypothetical protein [Fodinibius salicampi]MCW9712322.1 hypothetical protein [Fodinibius salicampi]
MESHQKYNSAAKAIASSFGVLGGLGGLIHGIGEVLQGNIMIDGFYINSWDQGPIAMYLGGDPAITIFQSFLIAGIVTLIISGVLIVWSVAFLNNKRSGVVLMLLSVAMLLSGGGVGPPTLAILAGISASGINSSYDWWRKHTTESLLSLFSKLWPWIFALTVINGIFLIVGHVIAAYYFGSPALESIFLNSFGFAVITLIISMITGIGYDLFKKRQ